MITSSALLVALQHTQLTEKQAYEIAKLPSPFCVCKKCYAECEKFNSIELQCPPLYEQSYIAERIVGFMQFGKMQRYLLSTYELDNKKGIVFAFAFSELCAELFTSLVMMKMPLLATDPNQVNSNIAKMQRRRRYETIEEAEAEVQEHWRRRIQAEMCEHRRGRA